MSLVLVGGDDVDLGILEDRLPVEPAREQNTKLEGRANGLDFDDSRAMHWENGNCDQGASGAPARLAAFWSLARGRPKIARICATI